MIFLLSFILINTISDQPNIRSPVKEIAKKTSVNQKVLESSQDRVILSPSKRSKYPINVKSWVKLIDENFESGMPSGWTVINGDNDAFTWVVGTYLWTPPPDYGTSYCCYDDDAAGEYSISGDSIQTPAIGIPDTATYLYLSYGYGHTVYQGESLKVQVRYHNGVSWGEWQQLIGYRLSVWGTDTFTLDEYNDSLQVMWLYRDDHTYYSWGFGSSFDNVLLEYYLPAENDAGMYAINSPVSDTAIGAFVQVNGTVKNYGTNSYSFEANVNIYDPDFLTAFTNTIQVNNLAPSDTLNIDFGSFQLMKEGIYNVEMYTYSLDDTVNWNDSITTTFNSLRNFVWKRLPSPGIRTHDHTVVYDSINDLFFIIGGDSTGNQDNMDICLEFDPKINAWSTKQPMPTKRGRHRASYRNGYIHVLCGKDDWGNFLTTHEVYDIMHNSWTTKASAPIAVVRPGVVTWKDSLVYLIGGYDAYGTATTGVYYYNIVTNSWNTATSLPRGFHAGGVKIKGDSIFIVGGGDGSMAYSEILLGKINPTNPSSVNWNWGESLPVSRNYENGFAIKNNKAYMIGGHFMDGTNQVWEYDIQNKNWESLPDYPTSFICRGDFAERRNTPDSLGVIYCFMGDTSWYYSRTPTDECFMLLIEHFSGIEEENPEKNSISLNNAVCLTDEIIVNYSISRICDLKIRIYDITGRQVFSYLKRNIAPGQHKIRMEENLKNGIYFIRIEAGPTVKNEKVVLIH